MKNTLRNTLFTIAIISAPLASFAGQEDASKKIYDLPTYTVQDITVLPEPVKNPMPRVNSHYVGMNVNVKFTVNVVGKPEKVRLEKPLNSYSDLDKMSFVGRLKNAVKSWKFEPALDTAGNPIAVKVILPIEVVKKPSKLSTIAALIQETQFQETSEAIPFSSISF